jgi:hypothetical protein
MNWQRKADVKMTLLPDGHGVLSSESNDWVHIVNPVGALVWELSDGKLSRQEIIARIAETLQPIDQNKFHEEIERFLQELIAGGLLETKP